MARGGDWIENPVTGERFAFRATAADTDGKLLSIDYVAPPSFVIAPPHAHPRQEERTEVVAGTLSGRVSGRARTLRAGGVGVVAAGTTHQWRNGGVGELQLLVEFRPALRTEEFLRATLDLARAGKTDARGRPAPPQLAILLDEYSEELSVPVLPLVVQRTLASGLAAIARRRGYDA